MLQATLLVGNRRFVMKTLGLLYDSGGHLHRAGHRIAAEDICRGGLAGSIPLQEGATFGCIYTMDPSLVIA